MRYDRKVVNSIRTCHFGAKAGCPVCCEALVQEALYQAEIASWDALDIVQLLTLLEITYREHGLVAAYRRHQNEGVL